MPKLAINGGNPVTREPFPIWPVYGNPERENLLRAFDSGKWGSLHGTFVREFEEKFSQFSRVRHAVAVTNGSVALAIALKSSGIGPGDEVIVPGYTFIASAMSVLDALAKPVFADIEPQTLNIDINSAEALINEHTKAIMPVHFAGRPADLIKIQSLAQKHGLAVVEDACQAWGSVFKGIPVGSKSEAACFSFQSSKNISSGEGGMIITDSDEVYEIAKSLSNCGRSEKGLWYAHYRYGGNYRMTEFQAAVLIAQLERYPSLQSLREKNALELDRVISAMNGYRTLSSLEKDSVSSWHIYPFMIDNSQWEDITKADIVDAVRAEGVPLSAGYSLPVYKQPVFTENNFGPGGGPQRCFNTDFPDFNKFSLPNTEKACSAEAVWITQNMLLSEKPGIKNITEALEKVFDNRDELRK